MKAIVFDLDGTLIDSAPDLHAAASKMLEGEGLPALSFEQIRSFIGNGVPKLVERAMVASNIDFEPGRHARLTAIFLEHYGRASADKTVLFPYLMEQLEVLRAKGFALGVCTNKPAAPTHDILNAFGISDMFDVVVGGDALPVRKPDPAPLLHAFEQMNASQRLYVGDSEVDAETSQRAGVPFALFTEGYRKGPIETLPHAFAFADFRDLQGIVTSAFLQGENA